MGYLSLNNYIYDTGDRRIQTGPDHEGYQVLYSGVQSIGIDNGVVVAGTPLSGAVTSGTLSSGLWSKDANWRFVGRPLTSGESLDPRPYVPSGEILGTRNAFRITAKDEIAGAQIATSVGPKYPINPAPSQPRTSINPVRTYRYYGGRAPDNQNYTPYNTPEGNTAAQGKTGGGVTHGSYEGGILTNVLGSQGTSDRSQWRYNEPVYCQTFTEAVRSESPSLMGNVLRYVYRGSSSTYNVNYGGYITGGNAAGVNPSVGGGAGPLAGAGGYYPAGAPYEPVPYVSGDTSALPQPLPFEPFGWFQTFTTTAGDYTNLYDDYSADYMTTIMRTSSQFISYDDALYIAKIKASDLSITWSKKLELSTSPSSISGVLENLSKDLDAIGLSTGQPAKFPCVHRLSNGNYAFNWEVYTPSGAPSGRNYQYRCYYEVDSTGARVTAQAVRSTGAKSSLSTDNPLFRNYYSVIKTDLDDENYLQVVGGFSGELLQIWSTSTGFHPFALMVNLSSTLGRTGTPHIKPIPGTDKIAFSQETYSALGVTPALICATATLNELKLNTMNTLGIAKSYDAVVGSNSLQVPSTAPVIDSSNNFYVACWGWSGGNRWGSTGKNCVMKCDSNDNVIWSKHYNWEYLSLSGQMWYDAELVDNESKLIVVGRDKPNTRFLIHCIDSSNGQLIWVRGFVIGGISTNYLANFVRIKKTRASEIDFIIYFGSIITTWNSSAPVSAGTYPGTPTRASFPTSYVIDEPVGLSASDQPLYAVAGSATIGTSVGPTYGTVSYVDVTASQNVYDFNVTDTTSNLEPQAHTITSGVPSS